MKALYFMILPVVLCLSITICSGQSTIQESDWVLHRDSFILKGTLSSPSLHHKNTVILFISGSGPTDRDGNNPFMKNNSLKGLSDSLVMTGYTTLRFDKRGIGASNNKTVDELNLRFGTFISDAVAWCSKMKNSFPGFKIVIAGHSQGALIASLVAEQISVDGLISLAGTGRPIDQVIHEQLKNQIPGLVAESDSIAGLIKAGKMVTQINPMLASIYRPSVQPFLRSYMQYDPAKELQKLKIPILIIQGEKDLQVTTRDAELLHEANALSSKVLIENLNHVLKDIQGGPIQNQESYNNQNLQVSSELIASIETFLKNL